MKKITIVHIGDFLGYPPVISLVENLLHNKVSVDLISSTETDRIPQQIKDNSRFNYVYIAYDTRRGVLPKLNRLLFLNKKVRKAVDLSMNDSDILWTTTDIAIYVLRKQLFEYKHVMQLMELIQRKPLFPKSRYFDFPLEKYARKAHRVVVPDLDRAYIQQAWWDLKALPIVLPNKPYTISPKNLPADTVKALEVMKSETRKILFYAGFIGSDRNISDFAQAIAGREDYCFYMIGKTAEGDTKLKELLELNDNIVYLGYHDAPAHLEFFKLAHIGLTPYIPVRSTIHPEINALYCAPNKVYEYSAFGVPMIGTNVLGLKRPFEQYGIGKCVEDLTAEEIRKCIDAIDKNYEEMKKNCYNFFEKDDLDKIVKDIIEG
ncbi:TPA: glycosyltransferase [Streptococcus suis]|nr:Glycosyltransferase [Streptococcus suis]